MTDQRQLLREKAFTIESQVALAILSAVVNSTVAIDHIQRAENELYEMRLQLLQMGDSDAAG